MQRRVTFLGFVLSEDGVETDPSKIDALRNWLTPKSLRQSQDFVGLCQYYRRFVPRFSAIAAPLHALTMEGSSFVWTAQCQQAFTDLKDALTRADVLALPNEEGRFILDCDASDYGIGTVLSQTQNDVERPVCYASRLFNKHERNYNVTRKELLAVVTFTKRFKQYLLRRSFTIRTDYPTLQ